jgi:hypothetical protein
MRVLSVLAGMFAALSTAPPALAGMTVAPLRQVITRQAPVATYVVSNPTDRIVEARVGWADLSATVDGYAPATPAARARLSAAPYLIVSPARLRLEPGGRARITVRLRKNAAIPAGERRSHLLIETTPTRTPLRRTGGGLEADVGLGVSTPVILRAGLAAPEIAFMETKLLRNDDGLLELSTSIDREGRYSAYGSLVASMAPTGAFRGAALHNVAVHVDASSRRLTLPLDVDALPEGRLTLRYVGAGEYKGRIFAEKTFDIAPPERP